MAPSSATKRSQRCPTPACRPSTTSLWQVSFSAYTAQQAQPVVFSRNWRENFFGISFSLSLSLGINLLLDLLILLIRCVMSIFLLWKNTPTHPPLPSRFQSASWWRRRGPGRTPSSSAAYSGPRSSSALSTWKAMGKGEGVDFMVGGVNGGRSSGHPACNFPTSFCEGHLLPHPSYTSRL